MGWVSRSNPALVEAIVASFHESTEAVGRRLSRFTAKDWAGTEFWLDTSGLALYFLERLQSQDISSAVDAHMVERLRQKRADNEVRIAQMLEEFLAIHRSFRKAGARYASLKGFTLFPDSCPDLSLRHQSDFDFLVDPRDLALSCSLLEQHGYRLTASSPNSLEFKTDGLIRTSLEGQYDVANRRSAELHVALDCFEEGRAQRGTATDPPPRLDSRLDRLHTWEWKGERIPALCPADQFIGQALHLFAHLRNEHTRASWLLEFRQHAIARRNDRDFWNAVHALARAHPDIPVALGLASRLAADLFGPFSPPEFDSWTADALPAKVRLWAERCGRLAVLADVPGTKLYLLLEDALQDGVNGRSQPPRIRRLIPLRRPDRMLEPAAQETLRLRLRREWIELRFLLFRLRFHLKQGLLVAREARRWRRFSASDDDSEESCAVCSCSPHPE
ncbi:MAG: nucleotidyltransferase family protein [Acidobacteriaceae bacterium]